MNILSLRESSSHRSAADRACRTIAAHADDLRAVRLGKRFVLEGVSFRLFHAGRNTIYQLAEEMRWFLKMPRKGSPGVIQREILGARACREQLSDCPGYYHPNVIRASAEQAYILTSTLPGHMAQRVLYRAAFLPVFTRQAHLHQQFRVLGETLARLHGFSVTDETVPTRTPELQLQNALRDASRTDETRQLIERTIDETTVTISPADVRRQEFVQGNFKLENILMSPNGITVIDFENCGRGSAYQDLALLSAQLLCIGTARHIPMRHVEASRLAFLDGYRCERQFDSAVLNRFVRRQVSNFYIRGFCCTEPRPTVTGVPVSRRKAQRLVSSFLSDEFQAA